MASRPLSGEDVRHFPAVAEGGSVSQAARSMPPHAGPATVNPRRAGMKLGVGEPLARRRAQGCEPAASGQRLLPAARRMAERAGEAGALHRLEGAMCALLQNTPSQEAG